MIYPKKTQPLYKRPLFITAAVIILVVLTVTITEAMGATHIFHSRKSSTVATTANQSTKGEITGSQTTNNTKIAGTNPAPAPVPKSTSDDTKSSGSNGVNLIDPTGTFVSAHVNVPSDAALSSVCNTTVGATCKIEFTSGATTKALTSQSTDSGGAVYWNSWTPASIGLTSGTWHIKAVAELSGKTAITSDAKDLEVR